MTSLLALFLLAAPAHAAEAHPVDISAKHFVVHGKKNEAVWTDHVKVVRGETTLTCDKLITHYGENQEVKRLECIGNVEATDGDKWAKGERADFDNLNGVLIVTGNPEARQGKNWIKGSKVTFYAGQDEIDVEDAVALVQKKGLTPPPPPKGKK